MKQTRLKRFQKHNPKAMLLLTSKYYHSYCLNYTPKLNRSSEYIFTIIRRKVQETARLKIFVSKKSNFPFMPQSSNKKQPPKSPMGKESESEWKSE